MAKSRTKAFSSLDEDSKESWWENRENPWFRCWSWRNFFQVEELDFRSKELCILDCDNCGHEFRLSPNDLTISGMWCPFCSGRPIPCKSSQNCSICFGNSIASISLDVVAQWSSKNISSPSEISKFSNYKFFLDCPPCTKEYRAIPSNISNSGILCPCCTNPKMICERDSCDICYKKSFAYRFPDKARLWSSKNSKRPSKILKGTDLKFKFNCDGCNHETEFSPNSIKPGSRSCYYCSNVRKLCGDEKCIFCFSNSFASFEPDKSVTVVSTE